MSAGVSSMRPSAAVDGSPAWQLAYAQPARMRETGRTQELPASQRGPWQKWSALGMGS